MLVPSFTYDRQYNDKTDTRKKEQDQIKQLKQL